jgi:hypothetical protein
MEVDTGLGNASNKIEDWNTAGHDRGGSSGAEPPGQAPDGAKRGHSNPELGKLAQDWITLWQSELSAMAADPELHTAWQTMMGLWAGTMTAVLRGIPANPQHDHARRTAHPAGSRTADAPRAAPAAAAPDPRDAAIDRLTRHVAALERRLADLERSDDPPVNPKGRPGRKPRR